MIPGGSVASAPVCPGWIGIDNVVLLDGVSPSIAKKSKIWYNKAKGDVKMSAIGYLFIRIFMLMFQAIVWICGKLRLGIPLLYVILCNTILWDWAHSIQPWTDYILFGMVGLVAVSWVVSLVRFLQRSRQPSAADLRAQLMAEQLKAAKAQGIDSLRFAADGSVIED